MFTFSYVIVLYYFYYFITNYLTVCIQSYIKNILLIPALIIYKIGQIYYFLGSTKESIYKFEYTKKLWKIYDLCEQF